MALTEINTKSIKDGEVKSADIADSAVTLAKIENGTTSDAGKFLKNNDGAAPSWETVDLTTFNSATTFNEDATFVGTTGDSNLRNVTWDESDDSLKFDDWTYLKFRTVNNSDSSATSIYNNGTGLQVSTPNQKTEFWGEGIHGRNSISGWAGDWFYVGTISGNDDQTQLYNGRNLKIWQTKTWGAEYTGTGAVKMPNGTTSDRPSTTTVGQLRYNTTTNTFEGYQGATPAWGEIGGAAAKGGGTDKIFFENGQTVTTDYTITDEQNAMSAGPIAIDSGVTVTIGDGETWTIV
jgi:hypothetical protein